MFKMEEDVLIAEFMNHLQHGNLVVIDNIPVHIENAKYHSSWDWLMLVVEKIESLGFTVFMLPHCIYIQSKKEGVIVAPKYTDIEGSKIESTYVAVVEFIKWRKENLTNL